MWRMETPSITKAQLQSTSLRGVWTPQFCIDRHMIRGSATPMHTHMFAMHECTGTCGYVCECIVVSCAYRQTHPMKNQRRRRRWRWRRQRQWWLQNDLRVMWDDWKRHTIHGYGNIWKETFFDWKSLSRPVSLHSSRSILIYILAQRAKGITTMKAGSCLYEKFSPFFIQIAKH